MSNAIYFFATKQDLLRILRAIEAQRTIKYVRAGALDAEQVLEWRTADSLPDLGIAKAGDRNHENVYLIVDGAVEIRVRQVPQRRGGTRYCVDQQDNPSSIAFRPGGAFQQSSIIQGEFSTCTDHEDSQLLLSLLGRSIRQHFTKLKQCYVGMEALDLMEEGYRLTSSVNSPRDYDLTK